MASNNLVLFIVTVQLQRPATNETRSAKHLAQGPGAVGAWHGRQWRAGAYASAANMAVTTTPSDCAASTHPPRARLPHHPISKWGHGDPLTECSSAGTAPAASFTAARAPLPLRREETTRGLHLIAQGRAYSQLIKFNQQYFYFSLSFKYKNSNKILI